MGISDWSSDVGSSDLPVREDIDALGLGYVRLQTPDDKGLAQSIRQARKIAPNAAIGSNPIYFQSGPTTRGSGALADGGRNAGRAVGLIDGGVGKHPALTGHIQQRGFAKGAPAPSGHGTAVASLIVGDGKVKGAAPGPRSEEHRAGKGCGSRVKARRM